MRHEHAGKPTSGADEPATLSAVRAALARDQLEEAMRLLREDDAWTRSSLEEADHMGRTVLHMAASQGAAAVVWCLHDAGTDLEAVARDGTTTLIAAARGGSLELIDALLSSGAGGGVNDRSASGRTALYEAALGGHGPAVRRLLRGGADPCALTGTGNTVLMAAAVGGGDDAADALLSTGRLAGSVDARSSIGRTALHLAASKGHWHVARLLLSEGADPGAKASDGLTVLTAAAHGGSMDLVDALLSSPEGAAAINEVTTGGLSGQHKQLDLSRQSGVRRILEAVEAGAGAQSSMKMASLVGWVQGAPIPDARRAVALMPRPAGGSGSNNHGGWSALHVAGRMGHGAVVRRLLQAGADPGLVSTSGRTALISAVVGGDRSAVDALLLSDRQFDMEAIDSDLMNALAHAAVTTRWKRKPEAGPIVELLLEWGADPAVAIAFARSPGYTFVSDRVKSLLVGAASPGRPLPGGQRRCWQRHRRLVVWRSVTGLS